MIGVAIYHSNVDQYPKAWINQFIDSIMDQTENGFEIYELNYGSEHRITNARNYRYRPCVNYAEAMNVIYEWMFEKCDVVVNTNVDDYYHRDRIKLQLPWIDNGYDIVSCDYLIIDEFGNVNRPTFFFDKDVEVELRKGHNIISNPGHIMTKRVFEKIKFDPTLVPREDLHYWQECIKHGFKIKIIPERVHYRREHAMQEGNKY